MSMTSRADFNVFASGWNSQPPSTGRRRGFEVRHEHYRSPMRFQSACSQFSDGWSCRRRGADMGIRKPDSIPRNYSSTSMTSAFALLSRAARQFDVRTDVIEISGLAC